LKGFSKDQEFIEFLKNISLFVTADEEEDVEESSKLYKNLSFLRQKFQEYKKKKDSNLKETIDSTTAYSGSIEVASRKEEPRRGTHQSSCSYMSTLPERQRQQIEFIDEIYNKVVLASDKNSPLPLKAQSVKKLTNKENQRPPFSNELSPQPFSSSKKPQSYNQNPTSEYAPSTIENNEFLSFPNSA